jgi:DNA-binding response OmpR family regulator
MADNPRVLVVDDDAEVRDMLVEYLSGHGFDVAAADDAPAMWRALSAASFDLILLDRTMPSGDSVRLLPRLRQETAVSVILVTALGADADRIRGLEDGADDYITKPFVWGELTARMRAVLRRGTERPRGPVGGAGPVPPSLANAVAAAVLCADIAGYMRLMSEDEAGTLRAWWTHRSLIIEPAIAAHDGRIVKFTGDGFLAEFPGATVAIACAVRIQRGIAMRDRNVPENRRLMYRMGVHVGGVVRETDDIYGMTVNLAARLQSKAPPGGIAVSPVVRDAAGVLPGIDFVDCGVRAVKNFHEPIPIFLVSAPHLSPPIGSTALRPTA